MPRIIHRHRRHSAAALSTLAAFLFSSLCCYAADALQPRVLSAGAPAYQALETGGGDVNAPATFAAWAVMFVLVALSYLLSRHEAAQRSRGRHATLARTLSHLITMVCTVWFVGMHISWMRR